MNLSNLNTSEKQMHDRAVASGANFVRAEIAALLSIGEVDESRLFMKLGYRSTFAYAQDVMKLSEHVALNLIAIARKSREVPELLTAVCQNEISISNARVIVPVLKKQNAQEWLTKAKTLTKSNLEKAVVRTKPSEAVKTKIKPVAEGQYKLEVGLSEDVVEMLKRVQDLCCQSEQRHVDMPEMLATMAKFFLEKKDPVEKAKRAKIIRPGTNIPRRQRAPIPAAALHAVNKRDQRKCQAHNPDGSPCLETRWTHIHHIREVQHGGSNDPANLTTLCAFHHREHHRASLSPPFMAQSLRTDERGVRNDPAARVMGTQ